MKLDLYSKANLYSEIPVLRCKAAKRSLEQTKAQHHSATGNTAPETRERTAEGTESIKNLVLWILVRAGGLLKALQSCSIYGRFLLGSTYTSWLNPEPRYNVHQAGT